MVHHAPPCPRAAETRGFGRWMKEAGAGPRSPRFEGQGGQALDPSRCSVAVHPIEVRVDSALVLPGRAYCHDRPRALIAVVHGIGEHSRRYAAVASDLVRAGYSVVTMDLPGHGESGGGRGDFQWLAVRDRAIPALFTANLGMPGQPERLPRVLLGHSMGGVLALDHALAHPQGLAGVIASAPGLRSAMPPWWKLAAANVARVTAPGLGFPTGIDTSGTSRDPEVLRLRAEDRLMHDLITPRLYFAFVEARQRVLRDARRLAVPALVLHGEADRVVDIAGAREFCAAAPARLVTLKTYPEAYHEPFNDYGREAVVADVAAWLGRLLPE
jgi:acylglycerol lipase